ncbi:restriction endonuclease subunit S [Mucilaginibacter sp.]|uniref:restriction endonuclease subunit S n=1 Tax=Mucilaginibacter sp. TaxID=1882438 RepID=UPI003AFF9D5D
MKGLEITIQNYKSLNSIIDYRIEAEYFDKKFLKVDTIFNIKKYITFFEVADYENGRAYDSAQFSDIPIENGIRVSKIGDVTQKRTNESWVFVSQSEFNNKRGNCLVDDSILMTLTGDPPDVGKVNMFIDGSIKSTWNQRVARIYLKDNQNLFYSHKVLFIVLSNKYCREQLERYAKGIRQRNLGTECIERLKLPLLSKNLQIKLDKLISSSFVKLSEYKVVYNLAEALLLEDAGLEDLILNKELINVKNFKDSFLVSGRLDAEYYQKKYEEIVSHITTQKHDTLINLVTISKSIEPGSAYYTEDEGLPFYRVSDYNKFGLSEPDKKLTQTFVQDNKEQIENLKPKKGTILFSKDGSVGAAYLLRENLNGITSGAILHLQIRDEKKIIPEYLVLALNSKLVQMQAERDAGGSIILHWRKEEIEQVVVPIIDYKKQEEIAELIEESFRLKAESERLLEVAKKAVEMAIEEDEEVAIKFIKKSV